MAISRFTFRSRRIFLREASGRFLPAHKISNFNIAARGYPLDSRHPGDNGTPGVHTSGCMM